MPAFLANHSKLVAALLGNLLAILAVWLGTKGLATCTGTGDDQVCTVMGFTTTDITTYAMLGLNALFVWAFPANKPTA